MSAPTYFVEHRRGEVNELQSMLRSQKLTDTKKRGVIERAIAYMTLGIDVSKLFSDIVMATNTKDLVLKKMVYLYLSTYAEQKQELALLTINTLQKDCRDDDPMVRGLALRSLCSLRVPKLVEYIMLPIRKGLNDPSPYVRKAAVVGCAKLFCLSPESVKESDLIDILYNMLKDRDAHVVHNVMSSLGDILRDEGGMVTNRSIIMHLLNRIRSFDEWAQCSMLDLVAHYKPSSDEEMFDIMNLLESRLKHSNSAVVLGASKVFLNFTQHLPQVHAEVYQRIKAPLLTFVGGGSYHLSYPVLSHVRMLILQAPAQGVFDDQYRHFFVRYNDPPYIKTIKLDILSHLASANSASEILNELSEYVTDVDSDVAKNSIRTIGKLAVKVEECAREAIEHLMSFLDLHLDYVSAESCVAIKDILRKYPESYEEILPKIHKTLKAVEDDEGKTAVVWMIGEYGDVLDDAPYILEGFVDGFEDEGSRLVRAEILSATMKLFFKRPPEVQRMLGRLLNAAISNTALIDVRDQALLYYRLLEYDIHEAARVVNCPKTVVDTFAESDVDAFSKQLFNEFNTLAVVYGKPSCESSPTTEEQVEELGEVPVLEPSATVEVVQEVPVVDPAVEGVTDDLLYLDMSSFASPSPSHQTTPSLQLNASASCDPSVFQAQWGSLSVSARLERTLNACFDSSTQPNAIEQKLNGLSFFTIASGTVGDQMKSYFFAQKESSEALCLLEGIVELSTMSFSLSFKSSDAEFASAAAVLVDQALDGLY